MSRLADRLREALAPASEHNVSAHVFVHRDGLLAWLMHLALTPLFVLLRIAFVLLTEPILLVIDLIASALSSGRVPDAGPLPRADARRSGHQHRTRPRRRRRGRAGRRRS